MLQDLTQEQTTTIRLRIVKELFRRIFFNNLAFIHEDNAVSHFACKTHFVGYTQHSHTFFGQFDHYVQYFTHHFRIES